MKTFAMAFGAVALSTTAAFAQPMYLDADMGAPGATEQVYYAEPAYDGLDPYAYPDDGSYAPGMAPQANSWAKQSTPNVGAGTSRSSSANNG